MLGGRTIIGGDAFPLDTHQYITDSGSCPCPIEFLGFCWENITFDFYFMPSRFKLKSMDYICWVFFSTNFPLSMLIVYLL